MNKLLALILVIFITFSLVACGDNSEDNEPPKDNTDNIDTPKNNDDTNDSDENNQDKDNTNMKFQYVGLIDNNSVEILIDGEAKAFRLSEPLKNLLPYIEPEPNQTISINYEENDNNQLLLNTLTWESKNVSGEYVGQIDSNSIEAKVENTSLSFRLGEDIDVSILDTLNRGTKIKLDYYVNNDSQIVVTKINKTD